MLRNLCDYIRIYFLIFYFVTHTVLQAANYDVDLSNAPPDQDDSVVIHIAPKLVRLKSWEKQVKKSVAQSWQKEAYTIIDSCTPLPYCLQSIVLKYVSPNNDDFAREFELYTKKRLARKQKFETRLLCAHVSLAALEMMTFMLQNYYSDYSIGSTLEPLVWSFFATAMPTFCWNMYRFYQDGLQGPALIKKRSYLRRFYGSPIMATTSIGFVCDTLGLADGAQNSRLMGFFFGSTCSVLYTYLRS